MISYRYHLVTVIAIFLAIALGVVIGTSALNGAVVGDLRRQVSDLKSANTLANLHNADLQNQAGNADLMARSFGPQLLAGKLAKTSVVLIGVPGATSAEKDAIAGDVTAAGGTVSGRIQLTQAFIDPQHAADIRSLATSGTHPIGLTLPTNNDPGALAGALLGFVLLGHGQATDITSVLAGFSTLNMVKTEGSSVAAGSVVIVVAPGSHSASDSVSGMLLSFASQLAATGGPTVVAGDGAANRAGGLIARVRSDSTAKGAVSTVDNADTALGQLTTVLAAQEALGHHNGHFGTGAGVDGLLPGVSN